MATLPVAVPVAAGLNVMVNEVLCPGVNVKGKVIPVRLNPVPVADATEMVTLVPPLLVRVSD